MKYFDIKPKPSMVTSLKDWYAYWGNRTEATRISIIGKRIEVK